jgi:hypothetical protein
LFAEAIGEAGLEYRAANDEQTSNHVHGGVGEAGQGLGHTENAAENQQGQRSEADEIHPVAVEGEERGRADQHADDEQQGGDHGWVII